MTAPDHRTSGLDSNARGLVVLAVAVAVGLLLLLNAGGGGATTEISAGAGSGTGTGDVSGSTIDISGIGDEGDGGESSSSDETDQTTTSSVPEGEGTRPPAEVKVLVLNSGGPTGAAKSTSSRIGETGFVMQAAGNATARGATTTVVYYAAGYQVEAEAVAAVIGKAADVVQEMPTTSPGPGAENANVVVVLGADTPPVSSN